MELLVKSFIKFQFGTNEQCVCTSVREHKKLSKEICLRKILIIKPKRRKKKKAPRPSKKKKSTTWFILTGLPFLFLFRSFAFMLELILFYLKPHLTYTEKPVKF